MLIRQILQALKPYKNKSITTILHNQYSQQTGEEQEQKGSEENIQEENIVEDDKVAVKNTFKRKSDPGKVFINNIEPSEEYLVDDFLLFHSRPNITNKLINSLQQIQDLGQRMVALNKYFEKHRKKINQPLRKYQRTVNLNFEDLMLTEYGTTNYTRFSQLYINDINHQEISTLRLAKIKAFQYINEEVTSRMIIKQNIPRLKELYATGYFSSLILIPPFYDLIVSKTLNSSRSKGFYLNILYEGYNEQVKRQQQDIQLYNKLPIEQTELKKLIENVENRQLPAANPIKFYWSILHSNPQNFDKYGPYFLRYLKKLTVNNKSAQGYLSSITYFFAKQKAMNKILLQIFNINNGLGQIIGTWALTAIIFSRIKNILSSVEKINKVNFNDIFNMLRQINERNFHLVNHYLPKIIHHDCTPEIFMIYQQALKNYQEKNTNKQNHNDDYQTSKLEQLWNLTGRTSLGFQVTYNFQQDPLPIKCNIPQLSKTKNYHRFDKQSLKILGQIQRSLGSEQLTEQLNQIIQDLAVSQQLVDNEDVKEFFKGISNSRNQLLIHQFQKDVEKNEEAFKEKMFASIDSSIVKDILQNKYSNALDYLRLLITHKVDAQPQLHSHVIGLKAKSKKQGFIPNSQEEALFILKEIEKKMVYREVSSPKLSSYHFDQVFEDQFDLQNEAQQDQQYEQFLTQNPEVRQQLLLHEIQQDYGKKAVQEAKQIGMDKLIESAKKEQEQQSEYQNDQNNTYRRQQKQQEQIQGQKPKDKERKYPQKEKPKYREGQKKISQDQEDEEDQNIDNLEGELTNRTDKKKYWKDRNKAYTPVKTERQGGIFSKRNKKFSTSKQITGQSSPTSYDNYLKIVKQLEGEIQDIEFDFHKWQTFAEISAQFSKNISKINQKNLPMILQKFGSIPIIGDIEVLIKFYFLKAKSENEIPSGLSINFNTSLGAIDKNYGQYLLNCPFMFKIPVNLYNRLLTDQLTNFNRKQFKKIIAHFTLYNTEITENTVKLICDVCSQQKIGVTLLEILELVNTRKIKGSYQSVKIFAAGVQRYRNLETDLLAFLKKYCQEFNYNIEARIFEPYIQSIVQTEQYEKLNYLLEMLRHELRPKDYKLNENLSPQQNLIAEKQHKIKEVERFKAENFEMLEMVSKNLKLRTQIPPFVQQLFDEYLSKKTTPLNSRELGAGMLLYSQTEEKFLSFLLKVRDAGSENNQYVFECALQVLTLFGRRLRSSVQNIFQSTLYRNKISLNEQQLMTLGQIFRSLDIANIYNEYLEYILRYQPPINPQIKRLYYKIFNLTSDDYAKNQMSGLLDIIFNQSKEKDRMNYKKTKEKQQIKAEMLKNLTGQVQVAKFKVQGEKTRTTEDSNHKVGVEQTLPQQLVYSDIAKVKKQKKGMKKTQISSPKKQSNAPPQKKKEEGFQDAKYVYVQNLTKKQMRNKPLLAFIQTFMKRYEKTEADPEQIKQKQKGKGKNKGDKTDKVEKGGKSVAKAKK